MARIHALEAEQRSLALFSELAAGRRGLLTAVTREAGWVGPPMQGLQTVPRLRRLLGLSRAGVEHGGRLAQVA